MKRITAVVGLATVAMLAAGCSSTSGGSTSGGTPEAAGASGASGGSAGGSTPATGCKPGQYTDSKPMKAAWIYVGSPSDAGWTQAHDVGRKEAAAHFGTKLVTTTKENVPEGPQTGQVIQQLISQGNNIIFATSFGFQPAMVAAAKKNPKVLFAQATGSIQSTNLSQYYGAGENGDYLGGMAAGFASKSGKIGFVAPFPIPEVVREINAFTMGARAVHPGATVKVVWSNTWFDPKTERSAAQSLVSAGVDVLGDGQDSPTTGQVALAANVPWVGYDSNQLSFAPKVWLTATTYHWGPYYTNQIQEAMDCTWKSTFYYGGLKDGFVKMAPFGESVSAKARAAINKKKAEIIAGTFDPFAGPLKDQQGQVKVPEGTTLTVPQKYAMDWLVEGVDATIPKS